MSPLAQIWALRVAVSLLPFGSQTVQASANASNTGPSTKPGTTPASRSGTARPSAGDSSPADPEDSEAQDEADGDAANSAFTTSARGGTDTEAEPGADQGSAPDDASTQPPPDEQSEPDDGAPSGRLAAWIERRRAEGPLNPRTDRPWLRRWGPEKHTFELGGMLGMIIPARDLELFEPNRGRPFQGFLTLAPVAPELGLRVAYFPEPFIGVEVEGSYIPTSTQASQLTTHLWAMRGHIVAQLPFYSVTPFVTVGGGVLGVSSSEDALGNDIDQAMHLGIGTKFYINRRLMARLDLRDVISPRRGINAGPTNSIEILVGVSAVLGRERDVVVEPEPDRDNDGIIDKLDECPTESGEGQFKGCPPPPPPPPPPDRDEDGVIDAEDECIDDPGLEEYDGCPDPDPDEDGIYDYNDWCADDPSDPCMSRPTDQCSLEPEDYNGFQDEDGCPDELPETLRAFLGSPLRVRFRGAKSTVLRLNRATIGELDRARDALLKYPSIRIVIVGHVDNRGTETLSLNRADAIKSYLLENGIDAVRMQTRGAGSGVPIASNNTSRGRNANRRIEVELVVERPATDKDAEDSDEEIQIE